MRARDEQSVKKSTAPVDRFDPPHAVVVAFHGTLVAGFLALAAHAIVDAAQRPAEVAQHDASAVNDRS